ncbi:MAG: diguanylate cyclase [Gammaproteobacteria bacterium]|nr:diguanylate cyclase [Gammaproteobacteria bacterium]
MNSTELEKGTVLIVDDVPANLRVLMTYLEDLDFVVRVAEDGLDALEQAKYEPPDLILLDVVMPNMDGFEVCRHLKMNKNTRNVPVIFMTALADIVDKVKGFQVGAVDYITKPIQHEEVLARITTHLALRKLQKKLEQKNHKLEELNQRLEVLATTDCLTGLYNRYTFIMRLNEEFKRSYRNNYPLSLMMLDIDCFKKINDTYGHNAGDEILKAVAGLIREESRASDIACRYGGEEFCIALPHIDLDAAKTAAIRMCRHFGDKRFEISAQTKIQVTCSIGVAQWNLKERDVDLLEYADQALYEAKRTGRNRVCFENRKTLKKALK